MIRAKFYIDEVADNACGKVIRASVVYAGSEENDKYFKATPSGSLELTTLKPEILETFKVGTQFYADLTIADD